MIALLLDANLSPLTAEYLRNCGYDVVSLYDIGKHTVSDPDVVGLARAQKRIVVTFDQDFGEMYYRQSNAAFGAIVLRTKNQTVEYTNLFLEKVLKIYEERIILNPTTLIIVKEKNIRFVKK